jgi:hypothetical protein
MTLVHNMELDEDWGAGRHNTGKNILGKIIMKTRSKLRSGTIKPQPQANGAQLARNPPSYRSIVGSPQPSTVNATAAPSQKVHPSAGPSARQKPTPTQVSHRSRPQTNQMSTRAPVSSPTTQYKPPRRAIISVVGNSNTAGLANEINKLAGCDERNGQLGGKATGFTYRGKDSLYLASKIKDCHTGDEPSHVCIHTGDIDIRNSSLETTKLKLNHLVLTTRNRYHNSRILINTLSTKVNDTALWKKLYTLNSYIRQQCSYDPQCTYINCGDIPLRDSIHFTPGGVSHVAHKIWSTVNYRV